MFWRNQEVLEAIHMAQMLSKQNIDSNHSMARAIETFNRRLEGLSAVTGKLGLSLDKHLQIAGIRVDLDASSLGANTTVIKVIKALSCTTEGGKYTEELNRKAKSLLRTLESLEQLGYFDQLAEKVMTEVIHDATAEAKA